MIFLEALITGTACRYSWAIYDYGSITISYPRNLNMARTQQLLGTSKLRCKTPITFCREMVNIDSMPYWPTSPSALRAAQTPTQKLFYPWPEHFSWCLGFRLQDSIPMPGGVSPMESTKGSPGAPSHLLTLPSGAEALCSLTYSMHIWIRKSSADRRCNGISSTWAGAQERGQPHGFLWTVLMLLAGRKQHERGGSEGSPVGRQQFSETLFHSH